MAYRQSSSRAARSPTEQPLLIGKFQRGQQIGKGSFATVYSGRHVEKKSLAAIKTVELHQLSRKLRDNLNTEIEILKSLQHPHIVAIMFTQSQGSQMHIVMEFCSLGDLSQFIRRRESLANHQTTSDIVRKYPNHPNGGLNEVLVRHFLKQIASAIEFLHSRNVIHRDLKPQNLLLNPSPIMLRMQKPEEKPLEASENSLVPTVGVETLPMLKIADFGFARFLPQTSLAETLCGSPLYMAPEILAYQKYDAKADLWSVGTVTFEMLVGKPPYRAANHVELLHKIDRSNDEVPFPPTLPISRPLKAMIRALLKRQPTERVSFEAFFEHQAIQEPIPGLAAEDRPKVTDSLQNIDPRTSQTSRIGTSGSRTERTERATSIGTEAASQRQTPDPPNRRPSQDQRRASLARDMTAAANAEGPATAAAPKRPSPITTATAPARTDQAERAPTAIAQAMERRSSRNPTSPGASMLKEQLDRERIPAQRKISTDTALTPTEQHPARDVYSIADQTRELHEARERAAQDVAFERDYVLVEKRAVEVNAFADELAASPKLRNQLSPTSGAMVRRATTHGTHGSTAGGGVVVGSAPSSTGGRPDALHTRTASYERRYGPRTSSATAAITRALNMANARLFGQGLSPPLGVGKMPGLSPPKGYGAFPAYPASVTSPVGLLSDGRSTLDGAGKEKMDEDTRILTIVEDAASRSDVVYCFAEVKYKQLLPVAPSGDQGLGIQARTGEDDDLDLTVDAVLSIAEEALVLYVKTLAILAKAIDLAGNWWGQKNRGEVVSESGSSARTDPNVSRQMVAAVGSRMNNVVQWLRGRFNDCLEKSEFVGRKLVDAQKHLPLDHPGHPSNHPSGSLDSRTSIGTSAENITLTSGVTAEKLMYDRALEMNRAAAVNELVGEDLLGCERAYATALRMLEAVLEHDDEPLMKKKGKKEVEQEPISGMENEDRATVVQLVNSTRTRLAALRKKLAVAQANRRASLQQQQRPSLQPSPRASPRASPKMGLARTPSR